MPDSRNVELLATEMVAIYKGLRAAKQSLPRLHPAIDQLTHPVLHHLSAGPLRVSDLAAVTGNELSTVSRQVSVLTSHGLVAKDVDPMDGRAQVLTLTKSGHDLLGQSRKQRNELFQHILQDWSDEDVVHFTHQLHQFGLAMEASVAVPNQSGHAGSGVHG